MSDEADQGNDTAEFFTSVALRNQQLKGVTIAPGIGFCLNCGAEVEGERRWCDTECRDDWQAAQR